MRQTPECDRILADRGAFGAGDRDGDNYHRRKQHSSGHDCKSEEKAFEIEDSDSILQPPLALYLFQAQGFPSESCQPT
jgi:hypothetical protein